MLGRVYKKEDGTLAIQRLAGSEAGGIPLGTILPMWRTIVPAGYLLCDGSTFDVTKYPALYNLLGTDKLPDLRESTLVGVGTNSTNSITTHDTFTLGQFKDDQVGVHTHAYASNYGSHSNGLITHDGNTVINTYEAISSSPIKYSSWTGADTGGWYFGALDGHLDARSTWGSQTGEMTGDTYAEFWVYHKTYEAPYSSRVSLSRHAPSSCTDSDAQGGLLNLNLSHSHSIPSLWADHNHALPHIGTNTDTGNPTNRWRYTGERNGTITRTKQTGVNFVIKATEGTEAYEDESVLKPLYDALYSENDFIISTSTTLPTSTYIKSGVIAYTTDNQRFYKSTNTDGTVTWEMTNIPLVTDEDWEEMDSRVQNLENDVSDLLDFKSRQLEINSDFHDGIEEAFSKLQDEVGNRENADSDLQDSIDDVNSRVDEVEENWLKKVETFPSNPSVGDTYLYIGETTTTHTHGGIYEWVDEDGTTYWKMISAGSGGSGSIFVGTVEEWDALSEEEKLAYDQSILTDDLGTQVNVVDEVTTGNLNPVTSNAVAEAISDVGDELGDWHRMSESGAFTEVSASNISWDASTPSRQLLQLTIPKTGLYTIEAFMDQTGSQINASSGFLILAGGGLQSSYQKTIGNLSDRLKDTKFVTSFFKKGDVIAFSCYLIGASGMNYISNCIMRAHCLLDLSKRYDN